MNVARKLLLRILTGVYCFLADKRTLIADVEQKFDDAQELVSYNSIWVFVHLYTCRLQLLLLIRKTVTNRSLNL